MTSKRKPFRYRIAERVNHAMAGRPQLVPAAGRSQLVPAMNATVIYITTLFQTSYLQWRVSPVRLGVVAS